MNDERPESTFKLPSTKLDRHSSASRMKSRGRINKQCNAQGTIKPLNKSNSVESIDVETDNIIANLKLADTEI